MTIAIAVDFRLGSSASNSPLLENTNHKPSFLLERSELHSCYLPKRSTAVLANQTDNSSCIHHSGQFVRSAPSLSSIPPSLIYLPQRNDSPSKATSQIPIVAGNVPGLPSKHNQACLASKEDTYVLDPSGSNMYTRVVGDQDVPGFEIDVQGNCDHCVSEAGVGIYKLVPNSLIDQQVPLSSQILLHPHYQPQLNPLDYQENNMLFQQQIGQIRHSLDQEAQLHLLRVGHNQDLHPLQLKGMQTVSEAGLSSPQFSWLVRSDEVISRSGFGSESAEETHRLVGVQPTSDYFESAFQNIKK
ncbi:unnamed protein product [Protopolystoma xenopodis]|uniref:Uncharacterized protein n=1 Tax=Protopolystoma xenopodis TaxID=117903 RepID=A0A3S5B2S7_9PLAT|nr:unnamed protein product [Protopolystoma xenopodis]